MPSSNTGSAANGAVLIPEDLRTLIITPILEASQIVAMGVPTFPTTGTMRLPRITDTTAGSYFIAEQTAIPEAEVDYDEAILLPSSLRHLKMLHPVSGELVRGSQDDVLNAVGRAIAQRAAAELDRAFMSGTGATGFIRGLINIAGIQNLTPGAGAERPSLDQITDAKTEARVNGAEPTHLIAHPRVLGYLEKLRETADGDGQYLTSPDAQAGDAQRLKGLIPVPSRFAPFNDTTKVAEVMVVQANQLAIAYETAADLKISDDVRFNTDESLVRFVSKWDITSVNPPGLVRYSVDLDAVEA